MCIIIVNKSGTLTKEQLLRASINNPHGAGIMWASNGKINHRKSLNNEEIIAEYNRVRKENPDVIIALHFRIMTDGGITAENCHPYFVSKNKAGSVYLMHNGRLLSYSNRNTAKSDTRLYIADILKHIPPGEIMQDYCLKLIQQAIGHGNKFVLMNAKGETAIVNEGAGHWHGENWYSNYSYRPILSKEAGRMPSRIKVKRRQKADYCQICSSFLFSELEREQEICEYCDNV